MLEAQPSDNLNSDNLNSDNLNDVATIKPGPWFSQRVAANPLLKSSALFFISTTLVNGGNYLFNLLLGRWLGPALFADVSIIITLFLFLTFITSGFQQTAAKFSAIYSAENTPERIFALRHWLNRRSWVIGTFCLLIVGGGAPFWQTFFHTTSPWIFVIFALGLPVYFVQGIDRGILQGQTRFGPLAASYQAEMWVRLSVGLLLVGLGWAAHGAVFGLTLSLVATWYVSHRALHNMQATYVAQTTPFTQTGTFSPMEQRALLSFAFPVLMAETSLILINNSDVLIVKHFFDSVTAGQYAALALIGRIVFFATWSVVMTMFPLVAQKHQRQEPHRQLLGTGLGMVLAVSVVIVLMTAIMPTAIVQILFGPAYLAITPLLWLYAVATALFALANVLINYRLALGNRNGTIFALAAGILQVIILLLFHATLFQVVIVQVLLMGILLLLLISSEIVGHRNR